MPGSAPTDSSDTEDDRLKAALRASPGADNSATGATGRSGIDNLSGDDARPEIDDDDEEEEEDDDDEEPDTDTEGSRKKGKPGRRKPIPAGKGGAAARAGASGGSKPPAKGVKQPKKVDAFHFDAAAVNGFDPSNFEHPFTYAPDPTCRLSIDLKPSGNFCVGMGGALKTIRGAVSKKKKRFTEGDFDLDLTYITPKVSDAAALHPLAALLTTLAPSR